eukprot:TRINITY_DN14937_c0_g1_i1.p1 TRINITY_DN14937_c0_g1~~TRINITY_DN14937_c0_g1_i1.p1  ORF type:complete len:151 (-),score=30.45 TRINITY_DN14937_c0_g1_i1:177-629(-)
MIRRPPRSTLSSSSAASDVYKRQISSVMASSLGDMTSGSEPAPTSTATPVYEPPKSEPTPLTPEAPEAPEAIPDTGPSDQVRESMFVVAERFEGPREGYFFGTGVDGTGYYRDVPLEERIPRDGAVLVAPHGKGGCLEQCSAGITLCVVC